MKPIMLLIGKKVQFLYSRKEKLRELACVMYLTLKQVSF